MVATLEALTSPNLVATLAVILDFTKIYKSGSFKSHLSPSEYNLMEPKPIVEFHEIYLGIPLMNGYNSLQVGEQQ